MSKIEYPTRLRLGDGLLSMVSVACSHLFMFICHDRACLLFTPLVLVFRTQLPLSSPDLLEVLPE